MPRDLAPSRLLPKLSKLSGVPLLVIGDLMVDRFLRGAVNRLSPEAPVPVVDVQEERSMPGGAGNVAANVAALGGKVSLIAVVGQDMDGEHLMGALEERGVDAQHVVRDGSRPTILKTRVIAGHQQVVRFDRESRAPLSPEVMAQILARAAELMPHVKGVILSDYGKGIVSARFLKALLPLARRHGRFVTVDPKIEHFQSYRGVDCITPNLKEAAEGMRALPPKSDAEVDALGASILKRLKCRTVLITRSERGMSLYAGAGPTTHIPTQAKEVFDVTGAGDTVISVLSLGLGAGLSYAEAAYVSNVAAGVVVGKLGTATCSLDELKKALKEATPL